MQPRPHRPAPAGQWAPERPWAHGGDDPLELVSAHPAEGHWRFLGAGEGVRLGMRVPATGENPPAWPVALLQELARDAVTSNHPYAVGHRVFLDRPLAHGSDLCAVVFTSDPDDSDTLLVVGLTADELDVIRRWDAASFLALVAKRDAQLVTDPSRGSLLADVSLADEVARGVARDGSSTFELPVPGLEVESTAEGVTVSLPREAAADLRQALAGRLLHHRPLRLQDGHVAATLAVADSFAVLDEATDVTVEVPRPAVESLLAALVPGAPGSFEPVKGLRVDVR